MPYYDDDGNEEIDIEELTEERVKFANELNKVRKIIEAIKNLEEQVTDYRQGDLTGKDETRVKEAEEIISKPFQQIISEEYEELKKEFKKQFKEKFPRREVIFLLRGKENQVLVISREQNKKTVNDLPKQASKNYALDLVEHSSEEGKIVVKIKEDNSFSQLFSSQEEAIEKSLEMIELTEEQHKYVIEKAKKSIENEKKGKVIKKEPLEKEQEKLVKILERKLLEKEIKALQENAQNEQKNENLDKKITGGIKD